MIRRGTTTNRIIHTTYGPASHCFLFIGLFLRAVGHLVIFRTVGAIVAELAGVSALVHDVDGVWLQADAHLNWAPFALGLSVVGLEVGFIYAYKVGWAVSTASIVQSAFLAVVLLFVGWLLYHEAIMPTKVVGLVICLVGLYLLNTA